MNLSKKDQDTVTIVSVEGDIDGATAQQLQDFVVGALNENNRIMLDVSGVQYMSSAGLRVLLVIYRKVNEVKGQIVLQGVASDIREAMNATGFLKHFVLVDSPDEGVKTLTAPS